MSDFDNALKDMEKEHPNAAAFVKEHQNDKITISFRDFVEKSANTTAEIVTSQSVALMGLWRTKFVSGLSAFLCVSFL